MEHDVVLVVPHYRLGPLGERKNNNFLLTTVETDTNQKGFLCLHTDEIPGNAGMLDQVEALRWVQSYISNFGGDPNKVTVMGESAGGIGSSMLNLSPLSTSEIF
jgi:acetylcholinesterase